MMIHIMPDVVRRGAEGEATDVFVLVLENLGIDLAQKAGQPLQIIIGFSNLNGFFHGVAGQEFIVALPSSESAGVSVF